MGWLITEKIHYLTKLPLIVIALLLFGLAPIILSIVGGALLQWFTGRSYDQSNSSVVASGWFFLITFPVAMLGVIVLLIVVIRDSIFLYLK